MFSNILVEMRVMKKLILFITFIMISLSVFAVSTGNIQFNVHWNIINIKTTTINILPYSGSGSLPQDQQERYLQDIIPDSDSVLYNVCLVRYKTNEKGTHKVEFSATPLMNNETHQEVPYNLYISYNNSFPVELDVNPEDPDNSEAIEFYVIGSGDTIVNIYLDAKITAFMTMDIGDYSSVVTIERITV